VGIAHGTSHGDAAFDEDGHSIVVADCVVVGQFTRLTHTTVRRDDPRRAFFRNPAALIF
jgi:hypothetical protein